MAIQYDPSIIQSHAAALYAQASRIVFRSGATGFFVGVVGGVAAGRGEQGLVFACIGGLVGAFIGVSLARGRAFALQLQAQTALCHVAIETNTRRTADSLAEAPRAPEVAQLSQVG
ncbi:hypothetical protein LZ198_26020 [Myxococcus sp. K15C18031901]|uniref:hypothetical protein n=1 Tax=Myxococcus dinghuensis TaxID=2906761 RepID=UPI0020A6E289|nr:hypothetical protein [Myxococcus dinghuensis]MCP3102333.1 hypothetical protein [Myxococcus dinghuensis]